MNNGSKKPSKSSKSPQKGKSTEKGEVMEKVDNTIGDRKHEKTTKNEPIGSQMNSE